MTPAAADEVVRTVLARVAPDIDPFELDGDLDLRDELDLDSMDVLALIEGVAVAVGVDIPEHDYPMLTTLTEFADYVAVRTDAL